MVTVRSLVAEKLGDTVGATVRERVVDVLVEEELTKRSNATLAVVRKLDEAMINLRKVDRPDTETFNADGTPASQTYSKSRLEDIKKAKELVEKLSNALEKAFEGNDFSKVLELGK